MSEVSRPVCGKCGQVMTPEDSRIHPEYFLHDACLPDELKSPGVLETPRSSNPYQKVIDRLRGERWSQRQDSTTDQLIDVLPLVYAMGCQDAGELIQRLIQQTRKGEVSRCIKFVKGDATQPQAGGVKIIAHICNNVGKWGSGFVMALSNRWPDCRDAYLQWYGKRHVNDFYLGRVQYIQVSEDTYVANMVAQDGIRSSDNKSPINYVAVETCLRLVAAKCNEFNASLHMPKIGSGLAGGDFSIIEKIIERVFSGKGISVTIYTLD